MLQLNFISSRQCKTIRQLKSDFKRTIYLNKYQGKVSTEGINQYLDFFTAPSLQEVNRLLFFRLKTRMIEEYTKDIISLK